MWYTVVLITLISLGLLVAAQAALMLGFVFRLVTHRSKPDALETAPLPAAIVLCLRGGDPFLEDCLTAILNQDHPDYAVYIIVDHTDDPAYELAKSALLSASHVQTTLLTLSKPLETCSLKCSSLIQAIQHSDPRYQLFAFVDADTIAHPQWLRSLTEPFIDPQVGATTGNRWYMPKDSGWGSLIRYAWNAAAIVQMYWYRIAWGGTVAVRRSVIDQAGLLDKWSKSLCEDTMLLEQLRREKLRVEFVPSLIMVNRETSRLTELIPWISRQLLTARLYHPRWSAVLLHGLTTTFGILLALVLAAYAWYVGQEDYAYTILGSVVLYQIAMVCMLFPLEWSVRGIVRKRGEPTQWFHPATVLRLAIVIPLTQVVYLIALLRACWSRHVSWRGIEYRIDGPWKIGMLGYRPFQDRNADAESHSL